MNAVIRSTGLWVPEDTVSNEELVECYNKHVELYNAENADAIKRGAVEAKNPSSSGFIEKASGIKSRYSIDKKGVLDVERMRPRVAPRPNDQISLMAECGVAVNMIRSGMAKSVLVVCPELTTAQLNFRDRDSHFIFGDVAVAMLIEAEDIAGGDGWRILGTRMMTKFSNNIRSNFGFMNACEVPEPAFEDRYFVQEGRKVYKEVCPMVADMILEDLAKIDLAPADLKRLWLHQANINMNLMVARKVLGRDAEEGEAPVILDEFANTAGAGSLVAFHRHHDGFAAGEKGLICSFGAGYSAGTVFVERL
jgi:3-oxoacyl-[acyl-carrier-protein] synthase III